MKKGNLPKQEYKLISMCMQGVENGIAYSCSDCGRTIFNFAIIKGEMDNKEYVVGLTCVKKLLNKTIYFSNETQWEYEKELAGWNNAMNSRKWLDKNQSKRIKEGLKPYELEYKEFTGYNGLQYCYLEMKINGKYEGHTAFIETKYNSVFNGIKN